MSACVRIRHDHTARSSPPSRASGIKRPHSPPPPRRGGRFRIAGADLSASITVFLIAVPLSLGLAARHGRPAGGRTGRRRGRRHRRRTARRRSAPGQRPAAGLTVVTAELIQIYGWRTTCAITVGAGLLPDSLLGSLRVARARPRCQPGHRARHARRYRRDHRARPAAHRARRLARRARPSPTSSACRTSWPICSPAAPLDRRADRRRTAGAGRGSPGGSGEPCARLPAALAAVAIATAVGRGRRRSASPGSTCPPGAATPCPSCREGPVLGLARRRPHGHAGGQRRIAARPRSRWTS